MKIVLLTLLSLLYFSSFAQWEYPPSKIVDSTDVYFGFRYKDSYRWLEDIKDPQVDTWFKNQAALTNNILNNITGKEALVNEWKELDMLQPPRYNYRHYENGRIFYKRTMPGESVGKAFYRNGITGEDILIFDPTTYISGKTLSIEGILPSYDGKKVIISYSENGAEVSTIKIYDVEKKKFLPESIYPSWLGPISWTSDNKSFTYFSQKTGDNTSPEFELNTKTKLHILGNDIKDDLDILSNESQPDLNIQPNDLPWATLEKDAPDYIFGYLSNVRNEYHIFYAPVSQLNSRKNNWKVFCTPKDKLVRYIEFFNDRAYAITYKDAPNYKLISTSLSNPDWEHAMVIADEKTETLEYFTHSKDFIFMVHSNGINSSLSKYHIKSGKTTQVTLPFEGIVNIFCLDTKSNNCTVGITSWIKPYTEFNYNAEKDVFGPGEFNKPRTYPKEYTDLVAEEKEVKGHDGVLIPLSLIYKKGTKLDGSNCCLLYGYGAYGTSLEPEFNIKLNSLAAKGVVIAMAHVRGGSEKGEAWYKAGYKTTKPNTWKDFNSCAEYLIREGYTSSAKMAGMGTSAGGILISRAITERPDLYAAAICNVGVTNTLRKEFTPNGPANIPEYGTVKDSIECRSLYEMDGVQHVVNGTKYPAVICVAGWNDPRVIAWQPAKFAAALQNASASGKPVLLKVNYDNGHFTEDKTITYSNFAAQFSFILWQCGHDGFRLR